MHCAHNFKRLLPILGYLAAIASTAVAFEGRINAVMIQGNQTNALLYTVGTTSLRVENTATNWPNPVDILDCNSGALTLLFPNNHSFVHLKPATEAATVGASGMPGMPMPSMPNMPMQAAGTAATTPPPPMPGMPNMPMPKTVRTPLQPAPGMPPMPNMPALPQGVGPQAQSGMPSMPAMPMPMMPGMMDKMELQATGQKTNLLGFACEQYQLKQRGETWKSGRRINCSHTSRMCKINRTGSGPNG